MAFVDKRLAKVCNVGENVFRNYTDKHMFVVGDKISYQIGNYEKEQYHYRIQGFVLAHGISTKGEPMYLLSQMNTVVYDSNNDTYGSDKRVTARWYTAREIHAEEGNKFCPKIIGYRTNRTMIRVCENRGIHLIELLPSERLTKKTAIYTIPNFNVPSKDIPKFSVKYYNTHHKDGQRHSDLHLVCTAYLAPDQLAAKTAFETGDKDYVSVETLPCKWNEKQGKYIPKKSSFRYYVIVDLTKK